MQVPVRLTVLFRPRIATGVLLAVAFSTFVLSSTPFLLDLVDDDYDVGLAATSAIGVGQLGGFVLGSWGAGRWLRPRRRVFVAALCVAVVANLVSAALPPFWLLVALRFVSGVSLGTITWFGWVQVFGDDRGMADVAVTGPLAGVVSGPAIALAVVVGGAPAVFTLLGLLAIVPLLFNRGTGAAERVAPKGKRSTPVPAAAVILAALGLFTLGGSAVFQYAVVVGTGDIGLSTGSVAALFSANAIASIPATRWPWRRGQPGLWLAVTGACAILMMNGGSKVIFGAVVVLWGFAFWMAVPGVFAALAARSANPADRAGDAQAVMAGGRVVGPLVGGLVLDAVGTPWLGIVGGSMILTSATVVLVVCLGTPVRRSAAAPMESDVSSAPAAE